MSGNLVWKLQKISKFCFGVSSSKLSVRNNSSCFGPKVYCLETPKMVTCHKKAGNFELFQKLTEVSRTIKTASAGAKKDSLTYRSVRLFLSLGKLDLETSRCFRHFLTCDTLFEVSRFDPTRMEFPENSVSETWWSFRNQNPGGVSRKTWKLETWWSFKSKKPVEKTGKPMKQPHVSRP